MSAREAVLDKIRRRLAPTKTRAEREASFRDYAAQRPPPLIPELGSTEGEARRALFAEKVVQSAASLTEVSSDAELVREVRSYLREHNLPAEIKFGSDETLAALPWASEAADLSLTRGASLGDDLVTLSRAETAIAESGSVVLASGPDNPTSLALLGEHHLVVVEANKLSGSLNEGLSLVRKQNKDGLPPRHLALITGPSRSADIEQTLLMGAHGPKYVHVLLLSSS